MLKKLLKQKLNNIGVLQFQFRKAKCFDFIRFLKQRLHSIREFIGEFNRKSIWAKETENMKFYFKFVLLIE